jgi:hypothetical protein
MFIIIGIFFVPTGLIDKDGNNIMIFAFLCAAQKLSLLKKQELFVADEVTPSSNKTCPADEPKRPSPI